MDAIELGARLSQEAYRPVETADDASARMAALRSLLPACVSVRTWRAPPDAPFGAFCVNAPGKSWIVFEGTHDIRDALVDAEVAPVNFLCPGSAISALVPSGAVRAFACLRGWLDALQPFGAVEVTVCGHSAGGWLAELTAVYLQAVTAIYTYGCPRISWGTAFLDAFTMRELRSTRVVHARDLVPHLPPGEYVHPCPGLYLDDRGAFIAEPSDLQLALADLDNEALADHHVLTYVEACAANAARRAMLDLTPKASPSCA